MASCFGILGMVEKGEAASCSDLYCVSSFSSCTGIVACEDSQFCPTSLDRCFTGTASEYEIKCDASCKCIEKPTLINRCTDYCCRLLKGNQNCKCDGGKCVFTGNCKEECVDITKCTGKASVVINSDGPTDCQDGLVCVYKESCKIASTVPMLPISANVTPANSITVSEPTSSNSGTTVNLSDKKLSEILEDLIKWLLQIVILIAILMIIVSGAMYMISAGDQQKADTAKKALTYAVLGLLVVALAYAIVDTLVDVLT